MKSTPSSECRKLTKKKEEIIDAEKDRCRTRIDRYRHLLSKTFFKEFFSRDGINSRFSSLKKLTLRMHIIRTCIYIFFENKKYIFILRINIMRIIECYRYISLKFHPSFIISYFDISSKIDWQTRKKYMLKCFFLFTTLRNLLTYIRSKQKLFISNVK